MLVSTAEEGIQLNHRSLILNFTFWKTNTKTRISKDITEVVSAQVSNVNLLPHRALKIGLRKPSLLDVSTLV